MSRVHEREVIERIRVARRQRKLPGLIAKSPQYVLLRYGRRLRRKNDRRARVSACGRTDQRWKGLNGGPPDHRWWRQQNRFGNRNVSAGLEGLRAQTRIGLF